jgi:glycosyltransferase involved in cell wall biosynthesis
MGEYALVTRELHPFVAGGIAPVVAALARELSRDREVTLVTSAAHRAECERLGGAAALYGPNVEIAYAAEPPAEVSADWTSRPHAWSAALYEALAERYPDGAPELIEFCDYLAEGFVTLQARDSGEPFLERSRILVRAHTTAELTSVLNGSLRADFATEAVFEAERYCLRHADRLLVPGGDVLASYERFYGRGALAPARVVPDAFLAEQPVADAAPDEGGEREGPLRLLYLGRLERRKGVQNLIRALVRSDHEGWRLTLLGADTETAPLGGSMRESLEAAAALDERIAFAEPVARAGVGAAIEAHDVVVVPSLWECWPNVVREAYLHNRPVLATPVGGLVGMVEPGRTGWLTEGTTVEALLAGLEARFERPDQARALIRDGAPRAAFDRLVDADATRAAYRALAGEQPPAPPSRRAAARPLVSVVVPYFHMQEHVEEAIASVAAQSWPHLEVLLVSDGSFREEDAIVGRLADEHDLVLLGQPNAGLSAARNFGIAQARGSFVLPLDPDNVLEPEFVERCLHALAGDESRAYATTWLRYIDEAGAPLDGPRSGWAPMGNWTRLVDRNNVAGDGTAVLRRAVFDLGFAYSPDLTSFEDWFLYRRLHHAGHLGTVVPRRLLRYRVRDESMLRSHGLQLLDTIYEEMSALFAESTMRWTARAA